jgi:hypothetical protein
MERVEGARSIFNPADAAVMGERGEITRESSIAEFFKKFGVDVNAPGSMIQARQMFAKQAVNSNMAGKSKTLAGAQDAGAPGAPLQGPGPAAGPVNMNDVLSRFRG